MKIDKICKGIANFINNSPKTQKVLRNISDSPAVWSTIGAFGVATTIRPATTIAISKDKTDGMYGACSSVASALVELIGGMAILKPMNKAIANSSKELYNSKGTIFYKNPELLRRYKSISNRGYKMPTLIVTSLMRFSLVYPISVLLNKMGIVKSSHRTEDKKGLDVNG